MRNNCFDKVTDAIPFERQSFQSHPFNGKWEAALACNSELSNQQVCRSFFVVVVICDCDQYKNFLSTPSQSNLQNTIALSKKRRFQRPRIYRCYWYEGLTGNEYQKWQCWHEINAASWRCNVRSKTTAMSVFSSKWQGLEIRSHSRLLENSTFLSSACL